MYQEGFLIIPDQSSALNWECTWWFVWRNHHRSERFRLSWSGNRKRYLSGELLEGRRCCL